MACRSPSRCRSTCDASLDLFCLSSDYRAPGLDVVPLWVRDLALGACNCFSRAKRSRSFQYIPHDGFGRDCSGYRLGEAFRKLPKLGRTIAACWPIGCAVLTACYLLLTYHSIWNALGVWVLYAFFWGLLLAAIQSRFGKVKRMIAWGITIALGVLCLIVGEVLIVLGLNFMQEGLLFAPEAVFAPFLFPPMFFLVPLVSGAPVLAVGRLALQRGGRRALMWSYAAAVLVFGALMFRMVS